ncbi:hypothetical protein V8E51_012899 [Hyaloscypha variabilis]
MAHSVFHKNTKNTPTQTPSPPWTLSSTVLPPPLICGLFLIIAIFATWELILRIAVTMAFCFGFRARNWKAWWEFDGDREDEDGEEEDEDEDRDEGEEEVLGTED